MDTTSYLNIVTQVDSFYNSAWEKLVLYGAIMFIVVGIIFPTILQVYIQLQQKHTLKQKEEKLKKEFSEYLVKLKEEIITELDKKFKEKSNEINNQTKQITSIGLGCTFHLQGNSLMDVKQYVNAMESYLNSLENYFSGKDLVNLSIVLDNVNSCLPYISYKDITNLKNINKLNLEKIINKIENGESGGAFKMKILEIKKKINNIKHEVQPQA
jgi:tRNA nucleotidyltransferase/poly(A) polymerase